MKKIPTECSTCKRRKSATLKSICGEDHVEYKMCARCPYLPTKSIKNKLNTHAECSSCHTTEKDIASTGHFGCPGCYSTFSDLNTIKEEQSQAICTFFPGHSLFSTNKTQKLLEKSLEEALSNENYEHAAWIRDRLSNKERF